MASEVRFKYDVVVRACPVATQLPAPHARSRYAACIIGGASSDLQRLKVADLRKIHNAQLLLAFRLPLIPSKVTNRAVRGFTVVDLTPQCDVRSQTHYEYGLLEQLPGAVDVIARCSGEIWKNPEEFEIHPAPHESRLVLRWRASATTAGVLSLRDNEQTLSISLLVSGLDSAADTLTLQAFQARVVRELHDTGIEPSFDLVHLWQRPLVASVGLFPPQAESDRWLFALSDRCFGAAYFRKLGLA